MKSLTRYVDNRVNTINVNAMIRTTYDLSLTLPRSLEFALVKKFGEIGIYHYSQHYDGQILWGKKI